MPHGTSETLCTSYIPDVGL